MSEPENKNSFEWREWYVRRNFGATTVEMIKIADIKNLSIFKDYLFDVYLEKVVQNNKTIEKILKK
jgi:hypothetical protein